VKLHFSMDRASKGETEDKTCVISFPADFEPSRFEEVFLWTRGEGTFAGKYVSPLSITGKRLPPPKAKTKKGED